jgi:3-methylfumaryl-CoA hydratase
MPAELEHLKDWIGRTQEIADVIAPDRVAAMAATLDLAPAPQPGDVLPPGWHWLFFNGAVRASELGEDGHPKRGGFLPPVPLPRRMWAGGRLGFPGAVRVGETVRRHSEIKSVEIKHGRSGQLVFVVVKHQIFGSAGLAIEEEHDIVYRPAPEPGAAAPAPQAAPQDGKWQKTIRPDPVLLFRYSALTFNGHRIHYDWPYVTKVEGYPGLVVHGPLTSTLLLELVRAQAPQRRLVQYTYRGLSPLFDGAPYTVNGRPEADGATVKLWAAGPGGELAMEGTVVLG